MPYIAASTWLHDTYVYYTKMHCCWNIVCGSCACNVLKWAHMCFTPEAVDFECFQSVDTLYFYKTLTKYIYCVLYNLLTPLFCVSSHDEFFTIRSTFFNQRKGANKHISTTLLCFFSWDISAIFFFFLLIVCHLDIQ